MAGPWEQYQQQQAGPWSRYGAEEAPALPASPARPKVEQEMHPDLTVADRLVTKNLSADDDAAVKYLQGKHPNLEISIDKRGTGQIIARKRDGSEGNWRVLDPNLDLKSTGSVFGDLWRAGKEAVMDLTDIGYDTAAGIGTTAASALGGVLGGVAGAAGGPVGAAAGATAGATSFGAAAGGGLEALRQAAGKLFIDQDMDWGNVGINAAIGGVSPLVFGTGATAGQVARGAAGAAGKGGALSKMAGAVEAGAANPFAKEVPTVLTQEVDEAAKALLKSQRGIPSKIFHGIKNSTLPKAGEMTSGVDADVIRHYADNPERIDRLTEGGLRNLMVDKIDETTAALQKDREVLGELMNTSRALADDMAAEVAEKAGVKAAKPYLVETKEALKPFQKLVESLHEAGGKTGVDRAEAEAVDDIMRRYFLEETVTTGTTAFGAPQVLSTIPEDMTANQAFKLKQRLLKLANFNKAEGLKRTLPVGSDHITGRIERAAQDAIGALDRQIDKAVRNAAAAAPDFAHGEIIKHPEYGYRFLQEQYDLYLRDAEDLAKLLKSPEGADRTLRTLGTRANRTKMELLQEIDARRGTNLVALAKDLTAHANFSNAPWLAKSGQGGTSTAKTVPLSNAFGTLGYLLGAKSGMGQGGAGVGAAAGAGAGMVMGGPAAISRYIHWGNKARKATGKIRDAGMAPNRMITPWLLMNTENAP